MGKQAEGSVLLDMFNQQNSVSCILEVFRTADSFFRPWSGKMIFSPIKMNQVCLWVLDNTQQG